MRHLCSLLLCGVLAACLEHVSTEAVSVTRVETPPIGEPVGYVGSPRPPQVGPFIKVSFSSDRDFVEVASDPEMHVWYDFFVCRARDQYIHRGSIYLERPGVYAAYVPADFGRLNYWVTGGGRGELGRGWPDELDSDSLCLEAKANLPYARRITGPTMRLPMDVHQLFVDLDAEGD